MTPQALHDLIQSDETAAALAAAGDVAGCHARCVVIAPKLPRRLKISRIGLMEIYESDPAAVLPVLAAIDASANPLIVELRHWMGPGVHPESYPDFGKAGIRAALTAPAEAGGLGLTTEQAAPLLAAGEEAEVITVEEVAAVVSPPVYRREIRDGEGHITVEESPLP